MRHGEFQTTSLECQTLSDISECNQKREPRILPDLTQKPLVPKHKLNLEPLEDVYDNLVESECRCRITVKCENKHGFVRYRPPILKHRIYSSDYIDDLHSHLDRLISHYRNNLQLYERFPCLHKRYPKELRKFENGIRILNGKIERAIKAYHKG